MGGKLHQVVTESDLITLQNDTYAYDANGNITSIADLVAGNPQTQSFTYDTINRLLSTTVTGGNNGIYSETNTYDTAGNLATNATGTLTYAATGHAHAASALGTNDYSYDANGSMISREYDGVTYTLTYDAENRMTDISGGTLNATYIYDGDGKRVRSVVNGTWTNYVGNYYETTSVTPTKYYYAGSQRIAWRVGASLYFGFGDHLGSTSVTVDESGNIIGSDLYKAWGADRYIFGTLNTTFKYTGQRQEEAGLYYYNARWYDPELGRFIQPDTIIPQPGNPLAWDRYAYTLNNPINLIDPSGHKPDSGCRSTTEGCSHTQREEDEEEQKRQSIENQEESRECNRGNPYYCSLPDEYRKVYNEMDKTDLAFNGAGAILDIFQVGQLKHPINIAIKSGKDIKLANMFISSIKNSSVRDNLLLFVKYLKIATGSVNVAASTVSLSSADSSSGQAYDAAGLTLDVVGLIGAPFMDAAGIGLNIAEARENVEKHEQHYLESWLNNE